MSEDRLEAAINTLAVEERVAGGSEILPGEDAYDWILEVSQMLQEILDEADG